ncbi:hypothetical protein H310_02608 [Aphanomyces invadans]|uniref:DDE Tnp4 domain-containing protein n=1 Tax=Aphanomyces invadans TaxID=157072 RepID=A0A024UJ53_9STRA|nr:hypothetical protein H310_02608 [Aphanomyces invadans]ETW06324.1 hypothetical protein H310_02608 [Aphanomyces invadans]|eukprot:XP_008864399.1 hypothetical protein H310_02608 [Aphanomyces invadans]
MTNFTLTELLTLYDLVATRMRAKWYEGRGARNGVSTVDAFFMMLTVLKHYQSWEKHAVDFNIRAPTFQKLMKKTMATVEPQLFNVFVRVPTMTSLRENNATFSSYPYALYATDVKFQPCERPSGRFNEKKEFFSGKHKLYGLKIEASVSPEGYCVDLSDHHPGATADISIFRKRLPVHQDTLLKTENEMLVTDNGELWNTYQSMWAVLVDKGYYGLSKELRAIHPTKERRNEHLELSEVERNKNISSDRVIVENFFGRVCMLWKVSYATFVWGHDMYSMIQRLTFALTNFHVSLLPLRDGDAAWYRSVLARYEHMAYENGKKKAEIQRRARIRRNERVALSRTRSSRVGRQ